MYIVCMYIRVIKVCHSIPKIIAQGANDTLFYAEFRTVLISSVCSIDIGAFRFEVMVANKPIFSNTKFKKVYLSNKNVCCKHLNTLKTFSEHFLIKSIIIIRFLRVNLNFFATSNFGKVSIW